jgi:folate-dependent phosphoribosylglycinamide formyltransferase PurN
MQVEGSRWGELILPAEVEGRHRSEAGLRVLAVAGFIPAVSLLGALIDYEGAYPDDMNLVALATDDPINADARIGLRKRVWKYYSKAERIAIEVETVETALRAGVPVYTGEIKIDWFRRQLMDWRPDVVVVCFCGQIFDRALLEAPRYGIYNIHPSDLAHGHGAGYAPHVDSYERGDPWTCWTVHRMVEKIDAGPVVGQSPRIRIANDEGRVERDVTRYYGKMKAALGPLVVILIEELVRLRAEGGERITTIDFATRFPTELKSRLEQPIPAP